jgi:hypothetical protein
MNTIQGIFLFFALGGFMTFLSRMKYIIDHPDEIVRGKNGEVRYGYMFLINLIEILIGGTVGVGAATIINYYKLLEGDMVMFAVAMSGLVGGKIFETVQKKLHHKIETSAKNPIDQFEL